jgi:hypothetical protein
MTNFVFGIATGILLMIGLTSITSISDYDRWGDEIKSAIEECEQELSRNKHCEPVISAKIKEE